MPKRRSAETPGTPDKKRRRLDAAATPTATSRRLAKPMLKPKPPPAPEEEEEAPRRVTRQSSAGEVPSSSTTHTAPPPATKSSPKQGSPLPTSTLDPKGLCVYGKALRPKPNTGSGLAMSSQGMEDILGLSQGKPGASPSPPSTSGLAKKRVLINSGDDEVRVFRQENPSTVVGSQEFDWAEHERQETQQLLLKRMKGSVLDEGLTRRTSRSEQAFSIFQIPYKLDTRLLSVKDLQTELKARLLPHTGPKEKLRLRLEAAIQAEGKRDSRR